MDSYIQVPTDSTGKKVRTEQRTVGANTVETHYFIDSAYTSFDHAAVSSISNTAVQLSVGSIPAQMGVLVKAANANTGTVYVGNSDVTPHTASGTDGFELSAGESLLVKIDDVNKVYVVASGSGHEIFYVVY